MTYTDDYLVQKLREILLKLYPTPETSAIAEGNPYSKFPKLFVSQSQAETGATEEETIFKKQEDHHSEFDSAIVEIGNIFPHGGKIEMGTETYQDVDLGGNSTLLSDLELFGENGSEFVGGVVHNVSSIDRMGAENVSLILGKVNSSPKRDLYDSALNRNLHEFIQVLKMSLGSSGGGSGVWRDDGGDDGDMNLESNGMTRVRDGGGEGGGGTVGMGPNDLEFNLTLDDIMDLNMLLGGSENVLQFKHVMIILLYCFIALVSIVGNLLVVQLVIRSRRLHTLTHALLANLAVADLLMATLNIPFSAARVILAEWPFGIVLCHLVPFVQVTSVYVTSGTMTVIAIDRYSVIMNPLGHRMKLSHGVLLVLGIWLVSGLLSLPYAIHHKVVRVLTIGVVNRCQADFSYESRRLLTVGTFLAQYLIPLFFTTISYVSVMKRLSQRSDDLGSTTPRQVAAQSKSKKKTIKMLQITVLFFAIAWAPINTYHLLTHFSLVRHDSTAILICHLIAMSSCTVNPFIYCWFNDYFRREALKWMRCFRTRRWPIVHPELEVNRRNRPVGNQTSAPIQSTTFMSTCGRSPRHPPALDPYQGICQGQCLGQGNILETLVERSSHGPSTSHVSNNGRGIGGESQRKNISQGSLSPHSSTNRKGSRVFDHPLSRQDRRENGQGISTSSSNPRFDVGVPTEVAAVVVRYRRERLDSIILIKNLSYEDQDEDDDIFTTAATKCSNQKEDSALDMKQDQGGSGSRRDVEIGTGQNLGQGIGRGVGDDEDEIDDDNSSDCYEMSAPTLDKNGKNTF